MVVVVVVVVHCSILLKNRGGVYRGCEREREGERIFRCPCVASILSVFSVCRLPYFTTMRKSPARSRATSHINVQQASRHPSQHQPVQPFQVVVYYNKHPVACVVADVVPDLACAVEPARSCGSDTGAGVVHYSDTTSVVHHLERLVVRLQQRQVAAFAAPEVVRVELGFVPARPELAPEPEPELELELELEPVAAVVVDSLVAVHSSASQVPSV